MNLYSLCASSGILIMFLVFKHFLSPNFKNLTQDDISILYATYIILCYFFARLMMYLENRIKFKDIHKIYQGGLTSYGSWYIGLVLTLIIPYFYQEPIKLFLDAVLLTAQIQPIMVRLGNYLIGELPGIYSEKLKRRHPSQLYKLFSEGFLMLILTWSQYPSIGSGNIFLTFSICYPIIRMINAQFEEDDLIMPGWYRNSIYPYMKIATFEALVMFIVYNTVYLLFIY